MAAKEVRFSDDAREKMLRGVSEANDRRRLKPHTDGQTFGQLLQVSTVDT